MQSVLIDTREPPEIKDLDFGVPSLIMVLDAGDAIITCDDGHTLVIERKTPSDLLGSIRDGRLFDQCARMRELSEFCYLVITGKLYWTANNKVQVGPRETGWNWDSVQGALLTVQEMGVSVVHASDFKGAVERLAQRDRGGVTIRPRLLSEPMEKDEAFLASLPDIGPVTAKRILSNGPACWALDWLTNLWDESIKIPGIGWNQKVRIRDVLDLDGAGREYLTVNLWEKGEENGE